MKKTDHEAAAVFYASLIVGLKQANVRRGSSYFPTSMNREAETYWTSVTSRTGGMEDLPVDEGGCNYVLALLEKYWQSRDDALLVRLIPGLTEIVANLAKGGDETDGITASVPEFVYPLH